MVTITLWVGVVWNLVHLIGGDGSVSRAQAALVAVVCAAVASWMTWVGVLFLQRPVEGDGTVSPEEVRDAELKRPDYAARVDTDRRAWRWR